MKLKQKPYFSAIKSIRFRVKNGKEVSIYLYTKKRAKMNRQAIPLGENYDVLVKYVDGTRNHSIWYDNRRELWRAYSAFTEKDLLLDIWAALVKIRSNESLKSKKGGKKGLKT